PARTDREPVGARTVCAGKSPESGLPRSACCCVRPAPADVGPPGPTAAGEAGAWAPGDEGAVDAAPRDASRQKIPCNPYTCRTRVPKQAILGRPWVGGFEPTPRSSGLDGPPPRGRDRGVAAVVAWSGLRAADGWAPLARPFGARTGLPLQAQTEPAAAEGGALVVDHAQVQRDVADQPLVQRRALGEPAHREPPAEHQRPGRCREPIEQRAGVAHEEQHHVEAGPCRVEQLHPLRQRVELGEESRWGIDHRDLRPGLDAQGGGERAHPVVPTWKPLARPVGGAPLTVTSSTRAAGGPRRAQATKASPSSGGPSASSSTVPSKRFRTQPQRPSRRASATAAAR